MIKENQTENLGEGVASVGLGQFYSGDRHRVTLCNRCEDCNKLYPISELAAKKE